MFVERKESWGCLSWWKKENTKPSLLFQQKTKYFLILSDSLFLKGAARGVFISPSPCGDGLCWWWEKSLFPDFGEE